MNQKQLWIRDPNAGSIIRNQMLMSKAVLQSCESKPVLSFKNFNFRCDESDSMIVNADSWNWDLDYGDRLSILTPNKYIRYQVVSILAELIEPLKGDIDKFGSVGWPVGVQGGLSPKLRVFHAIDFLREVYGDCLSQSRFSIDEFWEVLSSQSIEQRSIIKDLSRAQRDFFYLALSILFLFDVYLISDAKLLMSKSAKPLKEFLHLQLSGSGSLLTTTAVDRFRKEFCNKGVVIGPLGEMLFSGSYEEAIKWYDSNFEKGARADQDDGQFVIGSDLQDVKAGQLDSDDDF